MKLSEIISESENITERPLGIMKKAGLGIASKFSSKAAGKLASGSEANELRKDYDFYLGSSNQTATADSLLKFLSQEGHSTDAAQKALANVPGVKQDPSTLIPKNIIDQVFTSIAQGQVSTGKVQPAAPAAAASSKPPAGAKARPTSQVTADLDKMSDDEKRAIIKHLKTTDRFNSLGL
jgi:hypothetical protein